MYEVEMTHFFFGGGANCECSLKRTWIEQLYFFLQENAALCDEVARTEAKLPRARAERRFLLLRLLHYQALTGQSILDSDRQTAKKEAEKKKQAEKTSKEKKTEKVAKREKDKEKKEEKEKDKDKDKDKEKKKDKNRHKHKKNKKNTKGIMSKMLVFLALYLYNVLILVTLI